MSNYYFKKNRIFRSRKKGGAESADRAVPASETKKPKLFFQKGLHIQKDREILERVNKDIGRFGRSRAKTWSPGNGFGHLLSVILILLLLLFLFFSFFMQRPHMVFKRLTRNFIQERFQVLSYIGKEGDFSKSFILKASSDNADIHSLIQNFRLQLDLDTWNHISGLYLNYLGQDVADLTTTYQNGVLGLQSTTADDKSYFTTDIDRFVTAITNEDLDLKTYLDTEVGKRDRKKLFDKYCKLLLSFVNSENITVSKNTDILLDALDTSFKGKIYTVKPSAKEMEKLLSELGNTIRKDEDLRKLLKSSGMELDLLTSGSYNLLPANGMVRSKDVDVLISDFSDYLRNNAKRIANELETGGFSCSIGVQSNRIRYINVVFDDAFGFAKSFVFESLAKDGETFQKYLFSDAATFATYSVSNSFVLEKGRLTGEIIVSGNEEEKLEFTYDFEPKKNTLIFPEGEYSLLHRQSDLRANLRISRVSDKQVEYKLDLTGMAGNEGNSEAWSLELIEEDIPKLSLPSEEPKNMDEMSDSEYQDILKNLEKGLTDSVLALMGYTVEP